MDDSIFLNKYRESLKVAWGYNDYSDWPIRISSIMHLFTDVFAEEFVQDLNFLWASDAESAIKIGRAFQYPGRIFRLIDVVLFGMRRKRISLREQHDFIVKMIKVAATLKSGDLFSEQGTNPLIEVHLPIPLDNISSVFVHRLQAALFAYTEATLFRGHDATKSVHGPYFGEDGCYIIREYMNLKPDVLWDSADLLPIQQIRTVCHYNSEVKIRVDNFDHIYHEGNLGRSMTGCVIEVDGDRIRSEQDIVTLTTNIITKARKIASLVDTWDWKKKTMQYAEIFWLRKLPLSQLCGRATTPPEKVFQQISEGSVSEIRQKCLSSEEVARLIHLVL